jgi:hypothetical protein
LQTARELLTSVPADSMLAGVRPDPPTRALEQTGRCSSCEPSSGRHGRGPARSRGHRYNRPALGAGLIEANDRFRRDLWPGCATPVRCCPDIPTPQDAVDLDGLDEQPQRDPDLEFLSVRGDVAIAGRVGRQRLWTSPSGSTGVHATAGRRGEAPAQERRLRSLGSPGADGVDPGEPVRVGEAGIPVDVDGLAASGGPTGGARPAVRRANGAAVAVRPLVHDRNALSDCSTSSTSSRCTSRRARRWGYFALPVLHHDRLVASSTPGRPQGRVLVVHALHEDVRFTPAMRADVEAEIESWARGWG